ncbi:hypothetical protein HED60_24490 [Planctomycetales bacterium ZRK34]|nr:hypothetical protein HED60_24490 [Planctomycetales bacterium ZRK34]
MSIPSHRSSRRYRRDRTAARVGMLLLCVMVLLTVGGVWYLVGAETGVRQPSTVGPLFMLETGAMAMPPQATPEVIEQAAEAALTAPPAIKPAAVEPVVEQEPAIVELPAAPQPAIEVAVPLKPTGPMFNGRPIKPVRTVRMLVTAYSPDARSCGKFADNITASGYSVWTNAMKLVAADKRMFKFGTILTIPGYNDGHPVPVLDRGGKIKGHRLDVLYPTHGIARQWGAQWLNVTVWDYAD